MGGQNIERREALRVLSLAFAAGQFAGFQHWAFGGKHRHNQGGVVNPAGSYQPKFFSSQEYARLERLTELIIPNDGTPGAREAGVSEFIDFMVFHDSAIQYRFRYGLGWMDSHSQWLHGQPFLALTAEQQNELLSHLAYKDKHRPGEEDGRVFFELLRQHTVMGFYTTRIGMEELDHPGLKLVYDEQPGCPHLDDPEHEHLPLPRT